MSRVVKAATSKPRVLVVRGQPTPISSSGISRLVCLLQSTVHATSSVLPRVAHFLVVSSTVLICYVNELALQLPRRDLPFLTFRIFP